MTLGVDSVRRSARKYLGDGRPAAGDPRHRPQALARAEAARGQRWGGVGRRRAGRWSASASYTGVLADLADAGRRRRRRTAARRHRRSSSAGCSSPATGRRPSASACIVIGVLLPRRRALLVGVRAGRLDAESVRRSQHAATSLFGCEFPSSWFQSVNAMFIIAFAPVFAWLWLRLGPRQPSSPVKFAIGLDRRGRRLRRADARGASPPSGGQVVSPSWLLVTYLLHTSASSASARSA